MAINFIQTDSGGMQFRDDASSKVLLDIEPQGALYSDATKKVTLFDDFLGRELSTQWTSLKGSHASAVDYTVSGGEDGITFGRTGANATDTMANNGLQLVGGTNFKASKGNLVFETRVKSLNVDFFQLFVGFTDSESLEMPFSLGSEDALTSTASNAVGFLFDTEADTDNWFSVGVKSNTDATHSDLGSAPVGNTYDTLRVEINADEVARFYLNGSKVGPDMSAAVSGSASLVPTVAALSHAAAYRQVTIDYIFVQQDR